MKVSLQRMRRMGTYNAAGYDYLKKVIAPGGYWREFTYDTMGQLQTRVVQVSGGSQTTSYTYDNWGRLTTIDYPTSDDVSYTYDAENRRLSMTDGIGTQAYEYDAWGRVTRKTNCCGGDITSTYDPAGRRLTQTEEAHERTIEYTYDPLGRLETIGDYRGTATYSYDSVGRLSREDYPNETYVQYTYYGSTGSQAGQLHKQEHRLSSNNSLIIGYEYTYDALGRVIESVETPSEDTTEYEYWASGRLKKEERKGDVAYSREYAYNPDGSRDSVIRDDALNGSFWEVYVYNETSGRLESVLDIWTTDTHEFAWNPEGTLARWVDPNADYERVFSYDEEARLTKIERDHGQSLQTAYEYTYTGDGIRHMKKDHLATKEYRYGCSIDCGGMPLRVYSRDLGSQGEWNSVEDYLQVGTALGYGQHWQFEHSGGKLLMMGASGEPREYYPQDSNGLNVQSEPSAPCVCAVQPQTPAVCPPLGYGGCEGGRCGEANSAVFVMVFAGCIPQIQLPKWVIDLSSCLARCKELDDRCRRNADHDYEIAKLTCQAHHSWCVWNCKFTFPPGDRNLEPCFAECQASLDKCLADAAQAYKDALNRCDKDYDTCRDSCYERFPPKDKTPHNPVNK